MGQDDVLDAARAAVEGGRWHEAFELLRGDVGDRDDPELLELLASAAYGAGAYEEAVAAWEAIHAHHLTVGDVPAAAWSAAMVAMFLMMDSGLMAPVRGWLARADRLLADHDEVPAHAMLAMVRIYERFMSGDMEQAALWARRSLEVGERQEVPPAALFGRLAGARLDIFDGRVEEGLATLDEVAAALMAGELDALSTGMAQCELVCAMLGLGEYERAEQWTAAMDTWRVRGDHFGGINGRCRVHRAEMLRLRGSCEEAEEEALHACRELEPWMRREFGWPLTELGTIRLRRGDLAGAEEAFAQALAAGWSPQPGLALLRLAQGDATTAAALLAEAIDHPARVPSKERPPNGPLTDAPLLDAQVEAALAAGDLATAEAAAAGLASVADTFRMPALRAMAALARGRVVLARGDAQEAVVACRTAVEEWLALGVPYEAAVARSVLGDAHLGAGAEALARQEWTTAEASLRAVGAVGRADALAARVADPVGGTAVAASSAPRTTVAAPGAGETRACFQRDGDMRTLAFDGRTAVIRDLKGMRHLARLLAEPGREFHVLDLTVAEEGALRLPTGRAAVSADAGGGAGPMLDDRAREAYRRRLVEIEADIDEAERHGDLERAGLARADRDFLVAELSRAFGLSGRARSDGDNAERARVTITRALRYAIGRIREHHDGLADHLDHSIRTGTYCVYAPDPRAPVVWDV